MKKICVCACVALSLAVFVSASVWEGSAAMSGELPETGNSLATNSFPVNTVVDVTNLETGKIVRLVVSSGLDTPGFLALLSRDAAAELGIESRSPGRIRMIRADDLAALSRFTEARLSGTGTGGEEIVDLPDELPPDELAVAPAEELPSDELAREASDEVPEELPAQEIQVAEVIQAAPEDSDTEFGLVPSVIRPPEDVHAPAPDPSEFVAGITQAPVTASPPVEEQIDSSMILAPVRPPVVSQPVTPPPARTGSSDISAPIISILEKGKYYLQLAVYSKDNVAGVNYTISGIESGLPVTVREYYSERLRKPVYSVLIGPLNLGESGALLQRYKSMYHDAFVWLGK